MTDPGGAAFSIVIPAFNEEQAIAATIERTLAARPAIADIAGGDVEIIVVSDGSSDRTAEIARTYDGVHVIEYGTNRGYGAAIKTGFNAGQGALLGFLDGDGTCDPQFFIELIRRLDADRADVAVGTRLGPDSRMPAVRRAGNRAYAWILSVWAGLPMTDSASGMRVVRRSALARLYPLPDGLHFTPAMSSVAIFDQRLTIVEVPMAYAERSGESKLSVLKDGARFLRVITDTALTYRPLRFFGTLGLVFLTLSIAYGLFPIYYYLNERRIEEWMIYRLVAVVVGLITGVNLLAVGVLSQHTVSVIHENFAPARGFRKHLNRLFLKRLVPMGMVFFMGGIALNWRSLVEYATTGQVTAHWIYVLTGGLLVTLGIEFVSFGVLARVLNVLTERKRYVEGAGQPAPGPSDSPN